MGLPYGAEKSKNDYFILESINPLCRPLSRGNREIYHIHIKDIISKRSNGTLGG